MSTKEQILEAAKNRFDKKDFIIDKEKKISVTLHERPRSVMDELKKRIFRCDESGKPQFFNEKDQPDPKGKHLLYKDNVHPTEEWISTCIEPEFTVEELLSDNWSDSLKSGLFKVAQEVNGITVEEAAKN